MTALSTANPYTVFKIGNGFNNPETGELRMKNNREDFRKGELNPRFLQVCELDARIPEDWRLEVAVKDAGMAAYSDALIGATVIDLENRLFSSPL